MSSLVFSMLGEKRMDLLNNSGQDISKNWLIELKVAIMRKDFNKIEKLTLIELPKFSTINEMVDAKYLLKEALVLSIQKRNYLDNLMINVARNLEIARNSITEQHHIFNKHF